jgi:hypothetical protein
MFFILDFKLLSTAYPFNFKLTIKLYKQIKIKLISQKNEFL